MRHSECPDRGLYLPAQATKTVLVTDDSCTHDGRLTMFFIRLFIQAFTGAIAVVLALGLAVLPVNVMAQGNIIEIIDASGDGAGNPFEAPRRIRVDGTGNVYVAGSGSDNVFQITPAGTITEIIDASGDGAGNPLDRPFDIAVDTTGNVYVAA